MAPEDPYLPPHPVKHVPPRSNQHIEKGHCAAFHVFGLNMTALSDPDRGFLPPLALSIRQLHAGWVQAHFGKSLL